MQSLAAAMTLFWVCASVSENKRQWCFVQSAEPIWHFLTFAVVVCGGGAMHTDFFIHLKVRVLKTEAPRPVQREMAQEHWCKASTPDDCVTAAVRIDAN